AGVGDLRAPLVPAPAAERRDRVTAGRLQPLDVVPVAVVRHGIRLASVPRKRAGALRQGLEERKREEPGARLLRRRLEAVRRPGLEVRRVNVSRKRRLRRRDEREGESGDERETLHGTALA